MATVKNIKANTKAANPAAVKTEKAGTEKLEAVSQKSSSNAGKENLEKNLAIVLVRGTVKTPRQIIDTLLMLRLYRKNHVVVVPNTPAYQGMIDTVKDYVTWGEIDEPTYKELISKRGEEYLGRLNDAKNKYAYKTLEVGSKKYKPYFRLNPPRKGFGRKGVKVGFNAKGALGYRGEKINDLIQRML